MFFYSTHYSLLLLFTTLHVLRKSAVRNTSAKLHQNISEEVVTDYNLVTPLCNICNQFPHHWRLLVIQYNDDIYSW